MSEGGVLFEADGWELRRLADAHVDDYSLRKDGLYVEFSDAQWADYVWVLHATPGAYISVRHSAEEGGNVPDALDALLDEIAHGAEVEADA